MTRAQVVSGVGSGSLWLSQNTGSSILRGQPEPVFAGEDNELTRCSSLILQLARSWDSEQYFETWNDVVYQGIFDLPAARCIDSFVLLGGTFVWRFFP